MTRQLKLPIRLHDSVSFANFFSGDNHELLVSIAGFTKQNTARIFFLYGSTGAGKSHLLQSLSRQTSESGKSAFYVPMTEPGLSPALVTELAESCLVCIDDLDAVAGQLEWEEALLALYERLLSGGGALVVSAEQAPNQLGFQLADLTSRLAAGTVYAVKALNEEQLPGAMRLRAKARGLTLPDRTIEYLLRRFTRDSSSLFSILDRADEAALQFQRRLTVPFIKEIERSLLR